MRAAAETNPSVIAARGGWTVPPSSSLLLDTATGSSYLQSGVLNAVDLEAGARASPVAM
jgi:hypothetical protein